MMTMEVRALVLSAAVAAALIVRARRQRTSTITIPGFGSLLSERSSRMTFPTLKNFRVVRLDGFRRVFAHSPGVFVSRGITDKATLQLGSLSAEPCAGSSFIVTAFEVPDGGLGMDAFREREEEFFLNMVPYTLLDGSSGGAGLLCQAGTDKAYIEQWGQARFDEVYKSVGLDTCWGWSRTSGLRPCATYLRHCAIAAEKLGPLAHASFLDDTYLVDRSTTIRTYLARHPEVMSELPPESLRERYGG